MREDLAPSRLQWPVPHLLLENANIGRRYWGKELADIPERLPYRAQLLHYVAEMHKLEKDGRSLLLHGPLGTGKTQAACNLLMEAIARSTCITYFIQASHLPGVFINREREQRCSRAGTPLVALVSQAQFLVIDDIGADRSIDWNNEVFQTVIRDRYNDALPTFLTSNLDIEALMKRAPWLQSLAAEVFDAVEVSGHLWREVL
jgi:DNA replication protein DnaC